MKKIKKILVANRGEIAIRVMHSAKEMGISTVAVYSESDRSALHVQYADEAICIGPAPSNQSYLNMDAVIAACKTVNADAIHPGYGFLSENEAFAKKVAKAGIIFIGPSAQAIKTMGDKITAKKAVAKYHVPLVPGTSEPIKDVKKISKIAKDIGYPLLIKASAGGGGKGMRIVKKESELTEQVERAISEAKSAFGDGAVFIEKYIESPKHIEFQIMGDQHGNIVHLFERECSIQRRHQKVIEEAPSSVLDEALRAEMGKCAVDVAKACKYYGAGTVEFIMDEKKNYYFLEMNTRLQVEHPVTEEITGIDLVKEQIRVAENKKLSFKQSDLSIKGHAIELRVYAEDPENNFLPAPGPLLSYHKPTGPGIRVDDGYVEGMEIPIHYDPMIAKLVATASDRKSAIAKLVKAIDDYRITGIPTTLAFGKFAVQHKDFKNGSFDTHFVEKHFKPGTIKNEQYKDEAFIAAAVLGKLLLLQNKGYYTTAENTKSNWKKRLYED